jgi:hypothetical protein
MSSILRRFRRRRCCECREQEAPFRPLFQWCDHNDSGWVCMFCANVWGYLEYIKLT